MVQYNLKDRIGLGVLAGLLSLALSSALPLSAAQAQDSSDRPIIETRPEPQPPAAYAVAAEPSEVPAARTGAKGKQAATKRKAGGKEAGQPFIEFRSRHALSYGHTFVVFGRLNA